MRTALRCFGALAACSLLAIAAAQQPPTMEERVAALESSLATLQTRFARESTRQPNIGGDTGIGIESRVTALERSLERVAADVDRVARLADSAARDAANAQRTAEQAQRELALRR
jgi:hypothetical protein